MRTTGVHGQQFRKRDQNQVLQRCCDRTDAAEREKFSENIHGPSLGQRDGTLPEFTWLLFC